MEYEPFSSAVSQIQLIKDEKIVSIVLFNI